MNKLNLPTNWNQVTIKQFIELQEMDYSCSIFMQHINIISILADIDPTDKLIEEMDIVELGQKLSNLQFLTELPIDKINTDILNYKLIDLYKIKLGEFIDVDYYISENPIQNLSKIASILYKKYYTDDFGNIHFEQYDDIDLTSRSLYFESISIGDTFGIINYFGSFKKTIHDSYQNIFNPILNEEELDEEDLEDINVQKEIEREKLQETFSWELILYNLTQGDITKYDTILNLPLIFILNQLSFKKTFNLQ